MHKYFKFMRKVWNKSVEFRILRNKWKLGNGYNEFFRGSVPNITHQVIILFYFGWKTFYKLWYLTLTNMAVRHDTSRARKAMHRVQKKDILSDYGRVINICDKWSNVCVCVFGSIFKRYEMIDQWKLLKEGWVRKTHVSR